MRIHLILGVTAAFAAVSLSAQTGPESRTDSSEIVPVVPEEKVLEAPFSSSDAEAFRSPSKVFYPETWFHFIGGNVSREGIRTDLEAIASAGFSGVQLFHGKFGGVWPGTGEQIACLSPKWDELVRYTAEESRRLGLRFTMQGCPGWAMAGGPWVKPEDSMRHLVWSRVDFASGERVDAVLPVAPGVGEEWRDYKDLMVLAFPTPEGDTGAPLVPVETGGESLPGRFEAGTHCFEYTFASPTRVRTLELPPIDRMSHPAVYEPDVRVVLLAIGEDGRETTVLDTKLPQASWQDDRPISLCCSSPAAFGKYRLEITLRYGIDLEYVHLYSAARKNNWESEAGWTLRTMERKGDSVTYDSKAWLPGDEVLDITSSMSSDGRLQWTAPSVPEGSWTVLRIGNVNTGQKNAPAPQEATGWECNKLDPRGADIQFDNYLGRIADGPLAGGLLNGALFDSWECRTQTWTPRLEEEFLSRNGYALRPWIPALMGYVIDSPSRTARFLADWRRTLSDLLTQNFFGRMKRRSEEKGLSLIYETACADIFPGDPLEYFKYADVPVCEFWQPLEEYFVGSVNFKPILPTASAAHIYGKPRVAAESFTSFQHTWDEHWADLKEIADMKMTDGISHLIFHTYTHNPQVDWPAPGTSFSGANIGTPFLRGQTWWKYMSEFTTYFARCSYLLERGKPSADILWYLGDEIDHKPNQKTPVPTGFRYDYCNLDVLMNRLSVREGRLVTPEGVEYSLLWIPQNERMAPETIVRLRSLVRQGARVVADRPVESATLRGGKAAEKKFTSEVKRLWGKASGGKSIRRLGKGQLLEGYALAEAVEALGISPDVTFDGADPENVCGETATPSGDGVLWQHRTADGADWYFVSTLPGRGFRGEISFRSLGHAEIWNPLTGETSDAVYREEGGRTLVRLSLERAGAVFVVFRHDKDGVSASAEPAGETLVSDLSLGWELSFPEGWGAPEKLSVGTLVPWSELPLSAEAKAFSGTVTYSREFDLKTIDPASRYILELGDVDMIAEVSLNGKRLGVLWTLPYSVDITSALKAGVNELEVKVTSTWFNRLSYDGAQPEGARKTWCLRWPEAEQGLKKYGLMGPVRIVEKSK